MEKASRSHCWADFRYFSPHQSRDFHVGNGLMSLPLKCPIFLCVNKLQAHRYTVTAWPTNVSIQAARPRHIGGAVVWGPKDPALGRLALGLLGHLTHQEKWTSKIERITHLMSYHHQGSSSMMMMMMMMMHTVNHCYLQPFCTWELLYSEPQNGKWLLIPWQRVQMTWPSPAGKTWLGLCGIQEWMVIRVTQGYLMLVIWRLWGYWTMDGFC